MLISSACLLTLTLSASVAPTHTTALASKTASTRHHAAARHASRRTSPSTGRIGIGTAYGPVVVTVKPLPPHLPASR